MPQYNGAVITHADKLLQYNYYVINKKKKAKLSQDVGLCEYEYEYEYDGV